MNYRSSLRERGSLARRAVFAAFATILFLLECQLLDWTSSESTSSILWSLGLCLAMALTGFFPAIGGLLFCIVSVAEIIIPDSNTMIVLAPLGLYTVMADWVSRKWYLPALGAFLAVDGTYLLNLPDPLTGVLEALSPGIAAAIVGTVVRWNSTRVGKLSNDLAQSQKSVAAAKESVRRELVAELHDSVARDLVRIVVSSQALAKSVPDPSVRDQARALENLARESHRRLRNIITSSRNNDADDSLRSVIETCQTMLRARQITLSVDIDMGTQESDADRQILTLFIREGSTNILKYAPAGSTAQLMIETSTEGGTILTLTNRVDVPVADHPQDLSSGFGLKYLESRATEVGGTIHAGAGGSTWILALDLPAQPQSLEKLQIDIPHEVESQ